MESRRAVAGTCVLLALLAPTVGAQGESFQLSLEAPTTWVNLGQGVTVTLRVEDGTRNVSNARVAIAKDAAEVDRVTGAEGTVHESLYRGSEPGTMVVSGRVTGVLDGGSWAPASSNAVQATFNWTQVVLSLAVPTDDVPVGQPAPVTGSARWLHDNASIAGLRLTFLGPVSHRRITDADGQATVPYTLDEPGEIQVVLAVHEDDWPHGIWTSDPPAANVSFREPPSAAGGGGGGGGGGGSTASGPAECPEPAGSDQDGDGLDDACDHDADGDLVHDEYDAYPDDPTRSGPADDSGPPGASPGADGPLEGPQLSKDQGQGTPSLSLVAAVVGVAVACALRRRRHL